MKTTITTNVEARQLRVVEQQVTPNLWIVRGFTRGVCFYQSNPVRRGKAARTADMLLASNVTFLGGSRGAA